MVALVSPYWRWLVTDLSAAGITLLDHLASERTVFPKLNEPLEVTGSVPSDNSEVNRLHTDNLPFLTEGARQLYCFRREFNALTGVYDWNIRASTLILQIQDAATIDDAVSRFTAWDPWQYLFYRPVLVSGALPPSGSSENGYVYTPNIYPTMDTIIADMLISAQITNMSGQAIPTAAQACFLDWQGSGSGFYTGTWETLAATPSDGWHIEAGISVGQALQDICSAGYCDIWFEPLYDVVDRPGILAQLNLYREWSDDNTHTGGMGRYNWEAHFAWDRPGRSVVGVNDLFDGTQRANYIQFYNSQGGPPVTPYFDVPSVELYGEYWAQQFFPSQTRRIAVEAIAKEQLVLRKTYKQTLTINPAPERAPEPFVDYKLGDRVPIYVSDNARQSLPPSYTGAVPDPNPELYVWQRIYGIPVQIDDNGTETVNELIVGPIGPPPPADIAGISGSISTNGVAVGRVTRPVGTTTTVITPFTGSGGTR